MKYFIDDNPAEREIVRINLPSVEVLEIGVDPSTYLRTLSHSGFLETVAITDEDLNRTHQYADNRKRNLLANSFQDYDEYLRNLQMKAIISKFDESNLARITQLVNKTNQFNLTTKRYSETQIREIMNSPNFLTFYVKLKDKFGDNGLISVLIVELKDGCALIDTWLMSCRVLKRSVEHLVFDHVIKMLIELNVKKLKGIYIKTEKNSMTSNLLSNLGMSEVGKENEKIKFELTLNEKMNSKEIYIQTVEHSQY